MNRNNNNLNHAHIIRKTIQSFIKLPIFSQITVLGLIIITLFFIIGGLKEISTYKIVLNGNEVINVYEGGIFVEPGYTAYNYKNNISNNKVKISSNINFDKIGEYEVKYYINNIWKHNSVKRIVNVVKNPIDDINFSLIGDSDIVVKFGNKYLEPGYRLLSNDGVDYSDYVNIKSNVNDFKIGEYKVEYTLKINKRSKKLVRKVFVTGDRYTISYDKSPTNDKINLKLLSNINDFSYFIINDSKVYKDTANLTIKENGMYAVKMVNRSGRTDNIKFTVSNIDREAPTGTCNAYLYKENNNTIFYLDVVDSSGIKTLKYGENIYFNDTFTYDSLVDTGIVEVYDKAGNKGEISCNYFYGPYMPTESSKIVKEFYGDSLKYWVESYPTYYITHIWVSDAYNQFKTAVKEPFPSIDTAQHIMSYASKANDYNDKAMIGANGSGFVSNAFYVKIAKIFPKWKNSSISPVVMVDGEVKRNFTNIVIPKLGVYTYGLKSDGYFNYYNLSHYNDITANVLEFDKMVSDGVKYTFSFAPVLIHNGNVTSNLSTANNIRNAFGQIDKNNFIIVTNSTTNRSKGFNFAGLAKLMKKYGCIEAYNLDGGGSTNLVFKDRNTNAAKNLIYTTRQISDIIYFVEK